MVIEGVDPRCFEHLACLSFLRAANASKAFWAASPSPRCAWNSSQRIPWGGAGGGGIGGGGGTGEGRGRVWGASGERRRRVRVRRGLGGVGYEVGIGVWRLLDAKAPFGTRGKMTFDRVDTAASDAPPPTQRQRGSLRLGSVPYRRSSHSSERARGVRSAHTTPRTLSTSVPRSGSAVRRTWRVRRKGS